MRAKRHDLDLVDRRVVAVRAPVGDVERVLEGGEPLLVDARVGDRDRQLVRLAPVAHVELELDPPASVRNPRAGEELSPLSFELAEPGGELGDIERARPPQPRPAEIVPDVREQESERRGDARISRDDHASDRELLGDRAGVHRTGAAERDEREPARIVSARDGDHAESASHRRIRNPDDGGGRLLDVEAERPRDVAREGGGERVVFSVRPTLLFVKIGYVLAALGGILLMFILTSLLPVPYWISLPLALALLLIPAYHHVRRNLIKYTLTDSKVEIDQGFFSQTTRNLPLRNIQDVTVKTTLLQRILGFGDIVIDNASEQGGVTILDNIPEPRRYMDMLLRELRRWR